MSRRLYCVALIVALLALIAGCSKNPAATESSTGTSSVSQQFDGLTTSPETPAFGDSTIAGASTDEQPYNDQLSATPAVDSLENDPQCGVFHFRAIWGHLRPDSMETVATNWDGSLTLSRGIEVLRRTIRFERGTDQIMPRVARNKIEWTSVTTTHSDGIAVDLLVPRVRPTYDTTITYVVDSVNDSTPVIHVDTIPAEPATLEFKTGPYTRTFTLAELMKLDTIVYLDDSNAVAFTSWQIERLACPRGFLAGVWGTDSTGLGVFGGAWMSAHGVIAGFYQGHYDVDSSGEKVFFGKWIDMNGQFQGFLRGTWGRMPSRNASENAQRQAGGWFSGGVYDANAMPIGVLRGNFKGAGNRNAGFMQGRWKIYCPNEPADSTGSSDDGMPRM
jgi:hypothetical protein